MQVLKSGLSTPPEHPLCSLLVLFMVSCGGPIPCGPGVGCLPFFTGAPAPFRSFGSLDPAAGSGPVPEPTRSLLFTPDDGPASTPAAGSGER